MLMPTDGERMSWDYPSMKFKHGISGVGGTAPPAKEESVVAFSEGTSLHIYRIVLLVLPVEEKYEGMPSLLGRDILNYWDMDYSPTDDRLSFEVRWAEGSYVKALIP